MTADTSPRGRHRPPVRRGWAPRALLSALTAPIGVVGGLGVVVASAALDRPALAVAGVLVAGVPGMYHAARSGVLQDDLRTSRLMRRETERELAAARVELCTARRELEERPRVLAPPSPTAPAAPAPAVPATRAPGTEADVEPIPVSAQTAEPVVPDEPITAPAPVAAPSFGLVDARIDTGELQRIWDLGEAPETDRMPVRSVAEPKVLVDLLAGGEPGRARVGSFEARVLDALLTAEADELTRALELPSRRGRHAAEAPLDVPLLPSLDRADARLQGGQVETPRLEVVRSTRRGRHAAS